MGRLAGAPGILRIETLELDLGYIAGTDWLDVFLARLRQALLDGLSLTGSAQPQYETADRDEPRARALGVERLTPAGTWTEALLAYLSNGWLPWWSDLEVVPGWVATAVRQLESSGRAQIARRAADDPRMLDRLLNALEHDQLEELLGPALPAALQGRLRKISGALFSTARDGSSARQAVRRQFWQSLFDLQDAPRAPDSAARDRLCTVWAQLLFGDYDNRTTAPQLRPALRALPTDYRQSLLAALRGLRQQQRPAPRTPSKGRDQFPVQPLHRNRQRRGSGDHPSMLVSESGRGGKSRSGYAPSDPVPPGTGTLAQDPAQPIRRSVDRPAAEPVSQQIPVTDAGLVLVHPFLPELFSRAGYCRDNAFAGEEAQHMAVRLLGQIAFGTGEAEEADLVLAKLLTGLTPEVVLLPQPPAPEEIEAAENLLSAVLEHWTALRSSSPDWLRSQFLRRDGLLNQDDTGPALHVETLAQDVLLSRLPWGFGVVALPWMGAPLSVKWID